MYKIFYMITKFQKLGGTQCNPTYVNAKMSDYKILKKKFYGLQNFKYYGTPSVIPHMQMQRCQITKFSNIFYVLQNFRN